MTQKTNTLQRITDQLYDNTGLTAHVAAELEFYLENIPKGTEEKLFSDCYKQFGSSAILTHHIEAESTAGQYEISLVPMPDVVVAAGNCAKVKEIISDAANQHGGKAIFDAKPYDDKPGNGLHIHINLYDEEGENLFQKENADSPDESPLLCQSIAGLLETLPEAMIFFAPSEDSYKRFDAKDVLENHAPINISWGGNNRSVAIRIPTSTVKPESRHLEHRVAGADANPHDVIAAIVAGIDYGVSNVLSLEQEKTWGNAFDKQYGLAELPKTFAESKDIFENGKILKDYLSA